MVMGCCQMCQHLVPAVVQMSPLSAGWAKVQEIRRHLAFFRESGKYTMVYMAQVRPTGGRS